MFDIQNVRLSIQFFFYMFSYHFLLNNIFIINRIKGNKLILQRISFDIMIRF